MNADSRATLVGDSEAVDPTDAQPVTAFAAHGLSVQYGGVHALSDFTMRVCDGQLVGLIGPNGAGKTTFIDAATGFARSRGGVELDGVDISKFAPDERARRGVGRTWQTIELFDDLSVLENLTVAARRLPLRQAWRNAVSGAQSRGEAVDIAFFREYSGLPPETKEQLRQMAKILGAKKDK